MKLAPHILSAFGVAVLMVAGCAEAEPAASGDRAATDSVLPDTPTGVVAAPGAPTLAGPGPIPDCNAAAAQPFVGESADRATRARLLEAVKPVSAVRWVGPGDATTEDYSLNRLNVMLDAGGTIRSVHCG